jgi:hypothetical protein
MARMHRGTDIQQASTKKLKALEDGASGEIVQHWTEELQRLNKEKQTLIAQRGQLQAQLTQGLWRFLGFTMWPPFSLPAHRDR